MIDKPTVSANLNIVADQIKKDILNNLNCIQIGEIESFNTDNQTAVVEIKINRMTTSGEQQYSPLLDCPCFCLSGSLGGIDIPISKGDTCIVLFNDRSINEWFTTNQAQIPKIYRTHDISDALILVGIRSLQNLIENYLVNAVKIWYNTTQIVLSESSVDISKDTNVVGKLIASQTIKALQGYLSRDGSAGITKVQPIEVGGNVVKNMTIKDGLIVGID